MSFSMNFALIVVHVFRFRNLALKVTREKKKNVEQRFHDTGTLLVPVFVRLSSNV